jgi:hypothetical protein
MIHDLTALMQQGLTAQHVMLIVLVALVLASVIVMIYVGIREAIDRIRERLPRKPRAG